MTGDADPTSLREAARTVAGRTARWPSTAVRNVREDGLAGARRTGEATLRAWTTLASQASVRFGYDPGESVWERDWDVLLVLDACRVDLLREVAAEYPFVGGRGRVGTRSSVASKSDDWMRRTFAEPDGEAVRRTAYVTGNPHTARVEFPVRPAVVDEVWRDGWNEDAATVPARPVTDRAVATWRDREALGVDRMVVHYMQPHAPFVGHPELDPGNDLDEFLAGEADVWARLADGGGPPLDRVWAAYRDNLRYVLDDVSLLLDNLDADRVAVSADHGNAVGEFGVWGHPGDVLLPAVRRVPWVVTGARDSGEYVPNSAESDTSAREVAADGVAERLRELGYLE